MCQGALDANLMAHLRSGKETSLHIELSRGDTRTVLKLPRIVWSGLPRTDPFPGIKFEAYDAPDGSQRPIVVE